MGFTQTFKLYRYFLHILIQKIEKNIYIDYAYRLAQLYSSAKLRRAGKKPKHFESKHKIVENYCLK